MKTKIYLKIGKGGRKGIKVSASIEPSYEPLFTAEYGGKKTFFPTVSFAVILDIPDELFTPAERVVAELNVLTKDAEIMGEILVPKIKKLVDEYKGEIGIRKLKK